MYSTPALNKNKKNSYALCFGRRDRPGSPTTYVLLCEGTAASRVSTRTPSFSNDARFRRDRPALCIFYNTAVVSSGASVVSDMLQSAT